MGVRKKKDECVTLSLRVPMVGPHGILLTRYKVSCRAHYYQLRALPNTEYTVSIKFLPCLCDKHIFPIVLSVLIKFSSVEFSDINIIKVVLWKRCPWILQFLQVKLLQKVQYKRNSSFII